MDTRRRAAIGDDYSNGPSFGKIFGYVAAAIFGIITLTIIGGSWYTIEQYERGILVRNGAFVRVLQPGLGFKWPWIESVIRIDVRIETQQYKDMEAYSADQQPANLRVSVTFEPNEDEASLKVLYENFAGRETAERALIDPSVYKNTKIVFGQYTASRAIQERSRLNLDVEIAVKAPLENSIFRIRSVQVEDVSFGREYMKAIDARMQAEVEVQRFKQTLEREKVEAEIKRTQASGIADALKTNADAQAYSAKIIGNAEAEAIRAKGDALAKNPNYIGMVQAERWDGKLPLTMIPGGAVPMLNLQK